MPKPCVTKRSATVSSSVSSENTPTLCFAANRSADVNLVAFDAVELVGEHARSWDLQPIWHSGEFIEPITNEGGVVSFAVPGLSAIYLRA